PPTALLAVGPTRPVGVPPLARVDPPRRRRGAVGRLCALSPALHRAACGGDARPRLRDRSVLRSGQGLGIPPLPARRVRRRGALRRGGPAPRVAWRRGGGVPGVRSRLRRAARTQGGRGGGCRVDRAEGASGERPRGGPRRPPRTGRL